VPIPRSLFHPRWWLNGPPISKALSPWKPQYSTSANAVAVSQRLNDLTASGLQVLTARDNLTGLAKARFDNQLFQTNKALLEFADQVAQDDLLPTRLPNKIKKPKWAKPRKAHSKASGRSYTGTEAAEIAADKAEKSSKIPDRRGEDNPENSDGEIIVPATPPRPAQLAGESQGGTTITLALRTPERLRLGPNLAPRVSPAQENEPAWQLPASTAPPSLDQAEARPKRKREGTIRYQEGREDGYIGSVGLSQPRM
jgi:hypothetical protein